MRGANVIQALKCEVSSQPPGVDFLRTGPLVFLAAGFQKFRTPFRRLRHFEDIANYGGKERAGVSHNR